MGSVDWSVTAQKNLEDIGDYIAKDSKYSARNVIQEIVAKTETLSNNVGAESARLSKSQKQT